MRDDDPEDTLGDVFLSAMFGAHPVGRPVIGSAASVSAMTRSQLHSFHVRRYTPERMVVAVAGNVDHDEVVGLVREHFGAAPGARSQRGAAPQGHRAGDWPARPGVGQPGCRTDPHVAGGSRAGSALEATVGAVRAQHRARRRPEFAPVPTDSRIARAGLFGVFDGGHLLRQRRAVGICGMPARTLRRGGPGDHRCAGGRWPATGSPKPSAGSPRARCAVGWCSVSRTPARG